MTLGLFTMSSAIVAAIAFSLPAMADAPITDLSSQSIQVGPGGVRVGHDRYDSVGVIGETGLSFVGGADTVADARPLRLENACPVVV